MDEERTVKNLWQSQPLAESELSMELVIERADKFQRKIRFRNFTEYMAAAAVVAWAGSFALRAGPPLMMRAGMALIAVGALVVASLLRLHGHAARAEPPLAGPTAEVVGWHRSELERQRDLLRKVPLWYLGPFVPGLVVFFAGGWLASPDNRLRIALTGLLTAAVFAGVAALNARAARKLDEQIVELGRGLES